MPICALAEPASTADATQHQRHADDPSTTSGRIDDIADYWSTTGAGTRRARLRHQASAAPTATRQPKIAANQVEPWLGNGLPPVRGGPETAGMSGPAGVPPGAPLPGGDPGCSGPPLGGVPEVPTGPPPGVVVAVVPAGVVVVVVGTVVAQLGWVKVSVSSVTAPLRASARPWTVTPVVTVIDVNARMLPTNTEPVPSVAELPTCQKTLHAWAPLISAHRAARAGDERRVGLEDEDGTRVSCAVEHEGSGQAQCALARAGVHAALQVEVGQIGGRGRVERPPGGVDVRGGQIRLRLLRGGVGGVGRARRQHEPGRKSGDRRPRPEAEAVVEDAASGVRHGGAAEDGVVGRRAERNRRDDRRGRSAPHGGRDDDCGEDTGGERRGEAARHGEVLGHALLDSYVAGHRHQQHRRRKGDWPVYVRSTDQVCWRSPDRSGTSAWASTRAGCRRPLIDVSATDPQS